MIVYYMNGRHKQYFMLILFITFFFTTKSFAGKRVNISAIEKSKELTSLVQFYDTSLVLHALKDVQNLEATATIVPAELKTRVNKSYWGEIAIENSTPRQLALAFFVGDVSFSTIYLLDEHGALISQTSGEYVPPKNFLGRKEKTTQVATLHIPPNKSGKLIFHIGRKYELKGIDKEENRFFCYAMDYTLYKQETTQKNMIQSMIIGGLFFMALFNLMTFFSSRDRAYLYYGLYIICATIVTAIFQGGLTFLAPDTYYVLLKNSHSFGLLTICAYFLFIKTIFNLERLSPKLNKLIKYAVWGNSVIVIYETITSPYSLPSKPVVFSFSINVVLFFWLLLVAFKSKDKYRNTFILGMSTLLFGTLFFYVFALLGMHSYNSVGIVISIEVILFSLGLGQRARQNELERLQAKEALIQQMKKHEQLQQGIQQQLEETISIKTKDLIDKNEQLEQQKRQLSSLNQTKDRFFGIIAHDLRGPLSALQGITEVLNFNIKKGNTSALSKIAKQLEVSAYRVNNLLDNLLQWALNQQGTIPFKPEKLLLRDTIQESMAYFSEIATEKDIAIALKIPASIAIHCDKESINTVFRNLISNAIKFTPQGGKLEIAAQENSGAVSLSFVDNGVGMSKHQLKSLFELDNKKSTEGTSHEKGTGLGLLLIQDFIKMNKGQISIQSTPGKGTVINISLPIR